jgi:hypothetical protein
VSLCVSRRFACVKEVNAAAVDRQGQPISTISGIVTLVKFSVHQRFGQCHLLRGGVLVLDCWTIGHRVGEGQSDFDTSRWRRQALWQWPTRFRYPIPPAIICGHNALFVGFDINF